MDKEKYEDQRINYSKAVKGTRDNDKKFSGITTKSSKELEIIARVDEIGVEKEELRPLQGPEIVKQRRKRKVRK